MCHVGDLRLLVPKPLLDLVQLPFFGRQPLLYGPRLLDEPRPRILVALSADAPGPLVLALLQLVSFSLCYGCAAADRSSLHNASQGDFSVAIHSLAEMLTSRPQGGVLTC